MEGLLGNSVSFWVHPQGCITRIPGWELVESWREAEESTLLWDAYQAAQGEEWEDL
jgi:hypothetical protein